MDINTFMPALQAMSRLQEIVPEQEPDIQSLYQPETGMQELFTGMLGKFPERAAPNFKQKLFAGLGSLGQEDQLGFQERALYGDYYRKLADWKAQADLLNQAADNERMANQVNRQFAYNVAQDRTANRRIAATERYNQGRLATGEERADTYRMNAETNRLAAIQRGEIAREALRGGTIQFGDDGEAYLLTRSGQLKPLDVDLFSPKELQEMRDKAAMARTVQSGRNAIATKTTSPAINPNAPVNRPASATQQNAAIQGRALEVKSRYPEYVPYLNFDNLTGRFLGVQMPRNGSRIVHNQVNEMIFGSAPGMMRSTPQPIRKPIPGIPGGEAESVDGGKTWKRVK